MDDVKFMRENKNTDTFTLSQKNAFDRRQAAKLERRRKQKRADTVCITAAACIFGAAVLANLFQFNRPTVSEVERRELARFPDFSVESLIKGDFTSGINSYVSDTFIFRDSLVSLSKRLDTLKGIAYSVGDGNFAVLSKGKKDKTNEDDQLGELLNELHNKTETKDSQDQDEPTDDSKLSLSKSQLALTVGGGGILSANIPDGITNVSWKVDDENVLEIIEEEGGVKVKALAEGDAVVTCTAGDVSASCSVKVTAVTAKGTDNGDTADFMTNGLFIYGDAVYTAPWYIRENSKNYLDTAAYYKKLFPKTDVSVCVIPTSAICIDNEKIKAQFPDQKEIFDSISAMSPEGVNFVNVYGELWAHRDEYIYFRTDHHWTQRGAYYAYKAFVESRGLDATPIDGMEKIVLNENYNGSMYEYTKDERVKSFSDQLEAYKNTKRVTMTITSRDGSTQTYDSTIMEWSSQYSAFLCGDNPYTVINVPDNPQDKNILVLKDSYGDAMIPYLAENFGNIMIVDTRYSSVNVYETFSDYDLTDILFINNLEAANSPAWAKMYLSAVGVNAD